MKASSRKNQASIANPCVSIDGFPPQFTACQLAMTDIRPARPIVTRCGVSRPDARQVRMRRATRTGKREKHRRTGL
ncbi:hypothetical protein [Burkholderia lata]|uniref:hypothetical protein n=1 Tax=Burkholderia lata (strain ATCC 17760 / DSM 23089 / LMG 22485 / NCIMB 9086 / R18194 / 383) TaxID=482957 RepID=UPI0020C689F6|nr:hypothetical protein [Burkholderia lata]